MIPAPTGAADGGEGPAKPAGPLLRDADMAYREMKADASQRLGHTHSQDIVWARLLAEE